MHRNVRGNLTRHFKWFLQEAGPDHQKVHYATAKREPLSQSDNWALSSTCAVHGQIIGAGSGMSVGNTKQVAAAQALQYLGSIPAQHRLFSGGSLDVSIVLVFRVREVWA